MDADEDDDEDDDDYDAAAATDDDDDDLFIIVCFCSFFPSPPAIWKLAPQPAGQFLLVWRGLCGDDLARGRPVERCAL